MKLIIGTIILVILGIIAGIIAYMVEQNKKKVRACKQNQSFILRTVPVITIY